MRIRPNSTLAKLTSDQLDEIFDQIDSGVSLRDVQKFCEAAPPDGFGLRIHLITLSRFYRAERAHRHAEELAQARFNDADSADPEQLMRNVRVELAHACYDLAHHPGDPATVNSLSRITHRLDVVKLEQQRIKTDENRLALERDFLAEKVRQFNFNAAKEAAIYAHKIKPILNDKSIDLESKVWKVSDVLFGPPPSLPHPADNQ